MTLGRTFAITTVFLTALGAATAPFPSFAEAPQQSERLAYSLMFGGLHVGDALVGLTQGPNSYTTEMKMTSAGVMKWAQKFKAEMKGQGTFTTGAAANGAPTLVPQPMEFRREWSSGEFANNMVMTFDPGTRTASTTERVFNPVTGAEVKAEDLPWNGKRSKMIPVPADMRTGVLDPMGAFVAARHQLIALGVLAGPKTIRVPVYDGSRRYDIVGKTLPVKTLTVNGVERQVMPVVATMEPVFGFLRQSEKTMQGTESKIYFTPDARFIPVQVVVGNEYFSAVMNLTADCREKPDACAAIDAPSTQEAKAN